MGDVDQHMDEPSRWQSLLLRERRQVEQLVNVVIPIGVALAYETDFNRLLEKMLMDAMQLCNADGGTLYLRTEQDSLQFAIMRTESLGLALGGTTAREIPHSPIPLYEPVTGRENHQSVAAHAALTGQPVNVSDVYAPAEFDFSGPKAFDKSSGYRTKSLLAIPLADPDKRVTGVIQLVNARTDEANVLMDFDPPLQKVIECLCLMAGAAMTSYVRQKQLKDQVRQLRIEIDQSKRDRQVSEITQSDYFQELKGRARELKQRARGEV
jgi:hypothetical protein